MGTQGVLTHSLILWGHRGPDGATWGDPDLILRIIEGQQLSEIVQNVFVNLYIPSKMMNYHLKRYLGK